MFDPKSAQCKRCGNSIQYMPIVGKEIQCLQCGQVHVVMENGQLRRL